MVIMASIRGRWVFCMAMVRLIMEVKSICWVFVDHGAVVCLVLSPKKAENRELNGRLLHVAYCGGQDSCLVFRSTKIWVPMCMAMPKRHRWGLVRKTPTTSTLGRVQFFFWGENSHKLMVNWWFGARWFGFLGSLYQRALFFGDTRIQIPKHRAPSCEKWLETSVDSLIPFTSTGGMVETWRNWTTIRMSS